MLLVTFIGSPCSGKTTIGALVFAALKEAGQAVEFIPEVARSFIAYARVNRDALPPKELVLTQGDQYEIGCGQIAAERGFVEGLPGSIVITDSSPLNTLLYMEPDEKERSPYGELSVRVKKYLVELKPLVFYCPPLPSGNWAFDSGRIHDQQASRALDATISTRLLPLLPEPPVTLSLSTAQSRAHQVLEVIWNKLGEGVHDIAAT